MNQSVAQDPKKSLEETVSDLRLIYCHGCPYDRGGADRWYGRSYDPHWYPEGTYKGRRIPKEEMTEEQVALYKQGWDDQRGRKEW